MLQRFFERYTGFLRSLKFVYVINNLFHARQLAQNRELYRRFGLRKSIFSSIGSADFSKVKSDEIPWLDQPDAINRLVLHPDYKTFSPEIQQGLRDFVEKGYFVLKGFFSEGETAALNKEVEVFLNSGKVKFNYTGKKIFNLFESSELARNKFFQNPELIRVLSFALGKPIIPFQSLNFTQGSEQRAHSDSIHMTTQPPGYLIAAWIALENCTAENGPLFYFPGTHRLPYVMTPDYPSGNTKWMIGAESNRRYEDKIAEVVRQNHYQKELFLAKRGDVLIWHANLIHGGEPIKKSGATRKSMVCHYYAEGVICYHEISQRPALIPEN